MAGISTRNSRGLVQKSWVVFLKKSRLVSISNGMTASAFSHPGLIESANPAVRSDQKRAGLLDATRRMTAFAMVGVPAVVVALDVFWAFRSTTWSPVVFVLAIGATLAAAAFTIELWRRLDQLSDLTALNEELHYRATHDLLMDVPNRDQLQFELSHALADSHGIAGRVGLLFLDLDHFKFVNDTLGHAAGDELLKQVGVRMKGAIVSEDATFARVGGDEFVVLLRSLGAVDHLRAVADRLLAEFATPFIIDGVKLSVGTSIGMAMSVTDDTADDLYRHADAALYVAKERGRRQAFLADADLRATHDSRVRTELALRDALINDQVWRPKPWRGGVPVTTSRSQAVSFRSLDELACSKISWLRWPSRSGHGERRARLHFRLRSTFPQPTYHGCWPCMPKNTDRAPSPA